MRIEKTGFGWIVIDNKKYTHDVVIDVEGKIKNRYEGFHGTSHNLDTEEANKLLKGGPEIVFVGTGQYGVLKASKEALNLFKEKNVRLIIKLTPHILEDFNNCKQKKSALLHVTC